MTRYLWHLDPEGFPNERVDTLICLHFLVFWGRHEELPSRGYSDRPYPHDPVVSGGGQLLAIR